MSKDFENSRLICIGAGSFATIFVLRGQQFVFKIVQAVERTDELRAEFDAIHSLYTTCNTDSLFAIPRPIAYHNPFNSEFLSLCPPSSQRSCRDPRPQFSPELFAKAKNPAYTMDRAHIVPEPLGERIRCLFYASGPKAQDLPTPLLCRLYFGKQLGPVRNFVNPVNFPLDVSRYKQLEEELPMALCAVEEVAEGMGEMLAQIHWRCHYDGRDIENVMGGDGFAGIRYYVIDFNQLRSDTTTSTLVDAFFINDPYYPRPRAGDSLYAAFQRGYLELCRDHLDEARSFLRAIEEEQARRDLARARLDS